MFSNFFQSIKEIGQSVPVREGQKIRKDSNHSLMDEETEEGFVSIGIGRSSFIYTSQSDHIYPPLKGEISSHNHVEMPMPYGHESYVQNNASQFRSPQNQNLQTHISVEMSDVVRNVPFVLHPDLRAQLGRSTYGGKYCDKVVYPCKNVDFSEFEYDFNFERGVIRDIEHQEEFPIKW